MKTVSVIIPFYSNIDWLIEALDSVFSQTYPIHEVILVNDGSKEDISCVLNKYGDRICYFYQQNSGPAAARNNGVKHASGDLIAFEDSDDIWLPTKIEKQVSFMNETGALWSHVGFAYWWPEIGKTIAVDSSRDYDDVFLQKHVSTKIATPAVMIDRRVFAEGNYYFPEETRNGEDDQLWTMLSRDYKLALVQEPLVYVRMRGNNSQFHAIERFHLRVNCYNQWIKNGEDLPLMIHVIYAFYRIYSLFFNKETTHFNNFIAKCCWSVPYLLERIYVRYLYHHTSKDEKFIQRYNT